MFETFTVIPAIDLKSGRVVRLVRGEMARATVYGDDPAETARRFEAGGARLIHVVDLDGAVEGTPQNMDAIRGIRRAVRCELDVSGGLRTIDSVREAIDAGADRLSIGSAAFLNPALLVEACRNFPGRVFGSIDARDGKLAIRGWTQTSPLTVEDAIARFRAAGVAAAIVTDIARDGTEEGVDAKQIAATAHEAGLPVIASGGVASLDDVRKLARHFKDGVSGVVVGRALYEGRFSIAEAIAVAK